MIKHGAAWPPLPYIIQKDTPYTTSGLRGVSLHSYHKKKKIRQRELKNCKNLSWDFSCTHV